MTKEQRGSGAARQPSRPGGSFGTVATVVTVATVATVGCGRERGGNVPITRDSAGVTIIEYAKRPSDTLPWTIASQPVVEIGAVEGDESYQLSNVSSVGRLSDGSIVIANTGTNEVRVYDKTGRHLVTIGRKGEGPGEFAGLGRVIVGAGDTLLAYDGNLKRVSLFTPDGVFVRSFGLDFTQGFPQLQGQFADGTFLTTRSFAFSPSDIDDVVRDSAPVYHFAADGRLLDSVGRWLAQEWYVHGSGGSAWATSLPFGRRMIVAATRDGFYVGSSGRFAIEWRDTAGRLRRALRILEGPILVSGEDWDRVKRERMKGVDDRWRPRQERMLSEMPIPSTRPAFDGLQVDPDGNLWVAESVVSSDDPETWIVFAPDGTMLGAVTTPRGLSVREVGRDYVLGVARDDLDVEHVRMYVLDRRREGREGR
jgi:6-bladed beta-propeller